MSREYTPNDFRNGNPVKWCAGCGDHAIFNSVLKALPEVAERLDTYFLPYLIFPR